MDPRAAFWQHLLYADLPPAKVDRIAETVRYPRDYPQDPAAYFATHPQLSETERERAQSADPEALRNALDGGARLLLPDEFPARLAGRNGLPHALYYAGDIQVLAKPCVAVVGTRGASVYGKAAARKFSEALSKAGVTVASGGAFGIDAAAHEAALEAGGPTVAVLASGIDMAYPSAHAGLFKRIRERGCLVSQFACGTMPMRHTFVARNTVVAALCDGVLVVEAPEDSGSLITANAATDLGRQVFVLPANITSVSFRGSHALIRSGATLVDHPDQILSDLGIESVGRQAVVAAPASVEQGAILEALGGDPQSTEQIAQKTGIAPSELLAELTMLELDGRVVRAQGGFALKP
jgi:DNA processing protein